MNLYEKNFYRNNIFELPRSRKRAHFSKAFKKHFLLLSSIIAVLLFNFNTVCAAPPKPEFQTEVTAPSQIGDSGFSVPIPEIKMKNIIGDKSIAPTSKPKDDSDKSPAEDKGSVEPFPHKSVSEQESKQPSEQADEGTIRLPFEPVRSSKPTQQHLKPVKDVPEKEVSSPITAPPAIPEDTLEAGPPKKELVKKQVQQPLPPLLESEPVKAAAKTTHLEAIESPAEFDDEIPLNSRKDFHVIFRASVEPSPSPGPQPEGIAESRKEEASHEKHLETPDSKELASISRFPSPLEGHPGENGPEVKEYLAETAPILEELSLLMTRAPYLTIADFDPSDPTASIFPKDIYVKLDAMKRELQILDSKTFAIIPPPKYAAFHAVIRESIMQTYQACDAILSYFNDRSEKNLQRIYNHLEKAKELIRKTHVAQT